MSYSKEDTAKITTTITCHTEVRLNDAVAAVNRLYNECEFQIALHSQTCTTPEDYQRVAKEHRFMRDNQIRFVILKITEQLSSSDKSIDILEQAKINLKEVDLT